MAGRTAVGNIISFVWPSSPVSYHMHKVCTAHNDTVALLLKQALPAELGAYEHACCLLTSCGITVLSAMMPHHHEASAGITRVVGGEQA